jgi:thioredoxin-related protein
MKLFKSFISVIIVVTYWVPSFADSSTFFRYIDFEEAFDIAQKEGKKVMLYFHFDGCGSCLQLEKEAFIDHKVIAFYSENFISLDINTKKGKGVKVCEKFNIEFYPTLIFLDENGKEFHKISGYFNAETFLQQSIDLLHNEENLLTYNQQYDAGKRDPDFLYKYTFLLRDAYELDSTIINEYLRAEGVENFDRERNIRYLYEFMVHENQTMVNYKSEVFEFIEKNQFLFYPYFEIDQVTVRILWVLNCNLAYYTELEDSSKITEISSKVEAYMTDKTLPFKEINGKTTGVIFPPKISFLHLWTYFEKKDTTTFNHQFNNFYELNINDPDILNDFGWSVVENKTLNKNVLNLAIICSKRSIELNNIYMYNDTYAWLLYRFGQKRKAKKQAKKAIKMAKNEGKSYIDTEELIQLLK